MAIKQAGGNLLKTTTGKLAKTCGGSGESCTPCLDGTGPSVMQIEVSGIVNDDCVTCDDFNGTLALDISLTGGACVILNSSDCCIWQALSAPCSGCIVIRLTIALDNNNFLGAGADHYWLLLDLCDMRFSHDFGTTKPDCNSFSDFNVPFEGDFGSTKCDATGATVLLTSV